MRVGLVTAWSDSGAGYVSRAYRDALRERHEVFVLAREGGAPSADPYWNGPEVSWAHSNGALTGIDGGELRRWIRTHRLQVVIFNEQRRWDAVIRAREEGVVVGAYVDYYTQESLPLFALYDFVVCNTRRHSSVLGTHPQAFFVPWGTDCTLFCPRPRPDRPLTFFHSAGMSGPNDRKGTGLTLEAFRAVRGEVRLIVHAQLPLASAPAVWRAAVASDRRIEYRSSTEKPPGLYHLGDVYVYPCRLDGIGLSLPEALASGLCAITPDAPPWNEFVDPSVGIPTPVVRSVARYDGYYWPEVDTGRDALTKAMQSLADQPDEALAMGTRARKRAVEHMDWRKNGSLLASAVDGVLRTEHDAALCDAARGLDRRTNPTPLESWTSATRRLLAHVLKRAR